MKVASTLGCSKPQANRHGKGLSFSGDYKWRVGNQNPGPSHCSSPSLPRPEAKSEIEADSKRGESYKPGWMNLREDLVTSSVGLVSHLIVLSPPESGRQARGTLYFFTLQEAPLCLPPLCTSPDTALSSPLIMSKGGECPFCSALPEDGAWAAWPAAPNRVPVLPSGIPLLTLTPHLGFRAA